jgi:predicted component of type VI protein secretion system
MEHQDKKRILVAIRQVLTDKRHAEVPTVLAALRAKLDEFEPPKAERKTRETRDRQETEGRDRGDG